MEIAPLGGAVQLSKRAKCSSLHVQAVADHVTASHLSANHLLLTQKIQGTAVVAAKEKNDRTPVQLSLIHI